MTKVDFHPEQHIETIQSRLNPSTIEHFNTALKKFIWGLTGHFTYLSKRVLDVPVATLVLLLFSPMMIIVAIMIKVTDGGPVIYWQTRIGVWGSSFKFPKFRSMIMQSDALQEALLKDNVHGRDITFKMKKDPRITWIGRIIRKTSIDELPQLWCVLKGDMSLVGPRPPLVREVARYSLDDRRRLEAKPGLTCTWQISGRSDIPFQQQVQMDVAYIENQDLWTDLKILIKTVPAVITGRGAY